MWTKSMLFCQKLHSPANKLGVQHQLVCLSELRYMKYEYTLISEIEIKWRLTLHALHHNLGKKNSRDIKSKQNKLFFITITLHRQSWSTEND